VRGQMRLAHDDFDGAQELFRASLGLALWECFHPPQAVYWLGVTKVRRGETEGGVRLMGAAHDAVLAARDAGPHLTPATEHLIKCATPFRRSGSQRSGRRARR